MAYRADADAAAAVVAECGGGAFAVQADVSVEADVVRLFQAVDSAVDGAGRLGALVNYAGIVGAKARVDEYAAACG